MNAYQVEARFLSTLLRRGDRPGVVHLRQGIDLAARLNAPALQLPLADAVRQRWQQSLSGQESAVPLVHVLPRPAGQSPSRTTLSSNPVPSHTRNEMPPDRVVVQSPVQAVSISQERDIPDVERPLVHPSAHQPDRSALPAAKLTRPVVRPIPMKSVIKESTAPASIVPIARPQPLSTIPGRRPVKGHLEKSRSSLPEIQPPLASAAHVSAAGSAAALLQPSLPLVKRSPAAVRKAPAAGSGHTSNKPSAPAAPALIQRQPSNQGMSGGAINFGGSSQAGEPLLPAGLDIPDVDDLAERVTRGFRRRLEIERERRGGSTWR